MLANVFKVMFVPKNFFQELKEDNVSMAASAFYLLLVPILPALAWYWGTSQMGWDVAGRTIMLEQSSALFLSVLFYLGMLAITFGIAFAMHWMAQTYGATTAFSYSFRLMIYCATPVYLAGIFGAYPIFWLDIIIGIIAASYAIYLLYLSIPIVMDLPKERGFLFASSLMVFAMIMVIGSMGVITIIWQFVLQPAFIG